MVPLVVEVHGFALLLFLMATCFQSSAPTTWGNCHLVLKSSAAPHHSSEAVGMLRNSEEVLVGGHIRPPQLLHDWWYWPNYSRRRSQSLQNMGARGPLSSSVVLFPLEQQPVCSMSWSRARAAFASWRSMAEVQPSKNANDLRS